AFLGVLANRRACREPLATADVILAVGTRFGHRSLEKLAVTLSPSQALIHLDLDPTVIDRVFKTRVAIVGDARDALARLAAALGYAVPAPIGAKVARPERAVVAVAGDGGFMYSLNELATAVKYRLPIVFLVLNDERFGAIKWLQELMFGKWGEADLTNPDFPAL